MSIRQDIRYRYATLSVSEKIILINVLIFLADGLFIFLFGLQSDFLMRWFQLPKNLNTFIYQPWSLVTYSFFHAGFGHIFWNMLLLFFAGRIFLNLFSGRRFLNVYFLGAMAGGAVFLLSYNIFPVFSGVNTVLIGASAAVMAILIFVCTYLPNQEVRIIFFNIKLWYVGAFVVLTDLVQMPLGNAGGHLAHLGGAALGFVYAKRLVEGKDIGGSFERAVSFFVNLFKSNKKSPLKTVHRKSSPTQARQNVAPTKTEYQKKIDDILDKISKSGYESLSKEEKDFLFKAGKE